MKRPARREADLPQEGGVAKKPAAKPDRFYKYHKLQKWGVAINKSEQLTVGAVSNFIIPCFTALA